MTTTIITSTSLDKDNATATITVPVETILEKAEHLGYPIANIEDVALVWSQAMRKICQSIDEELTFAIEQV